MQRLIIATGLLCLSFWLLLFLDDDARSGASACGDPPPTATPGPPTPSPVPPTASPEVFPTVDLDSLPFAKAPAGLHAIAACQTRDQSRSMLNLLEDLLDEWEQVSIGKGPPPGMTLVIFEDPADSQRTIGLAIYGYDPPVIGNDAAQHVAGQFEGLSDPEASIATDSKLVWMRYKQDGYRYLTWGAVGGARYFSVVATNPADVATMVDALARAAEHACYPDCH